MPRSGGWYPPKPGSELDPGEVADMAAAFQDAVVDSMVTRTVEAVGKYRVRGVILGGGVASNKPLRLEMDRRSPVPVVVPRPGLCTDNGAMIGAAAWFHLRGGPDYQWSMDVEPRLRLG